MQDDQEGQVSSEQPDALEAPDSVEPPDVVEPPDTLDEPDLVEEADLVEELGAAQVQEVDLELVLALLRDGELELQGLLPWSSNYTFLATVTAGDLSSYVVYKPCKGERPLWDFPSGTLYRREVAAYLISAALGWTLVPPTVARDGPHGVGSVQLYIQADHDEHFFTLRKDYPEHFQRMAIFDDLINNADRKGGHCLLDGSGQIWAIDHGIAFHEEDKLRTVIWDWAGQPVPAALLADVEALQTQLAGGQLLAEQLAEQLAPGELRALERRVTRLLRRRSFPNPSGGRSVPWPAI
jgi:uncharacterized repeat protein (TIGR03843 family)